ncbi:hypothetical protein LJR220_001637 [Bradyrhizobium sp. LjRoot220]|uniref:hypothetical protein n=1 Tax=Bradyrhizobium sp. LjRoot220 TaxID=3342284 RepID=UPI003ECD184C
MHQAAARYWNEIAESQLLVTDWARQIFALPQSEMDVALNREEERLSKETCDPVLVAAYLKVMPLLWERQAIANFLVENPSLRAAMPPIEGASEALLIANKDFRLSALQTKKLAEMLENEPVPPFDFSHAGYPGANEVPLMTHLIDDPGPFETLEAWEQHLTMLQLLPKSLTQQLSIDQAKEIISQKRREQAIAKALGGPNHYILLCARNYAAALAKYRTVRGNERNLLEQEMKYLLESGKLEVEAEQRRRENHLASDIRSSVRDRKPLSRMVSATEAEAIRHFYATPPAPLLDTLSGEELISLGGLFLGWAQERDRLDPRAMIELSGWSDGMRILAHAVGKEFDPLPLPEGAPVPLLKFLATRAGGILRVERD